MWKKVQNFGKQPQERCTIKGSLLFSMFHHHRFLLHLSLKIKMTRKLLVFASALLLLASLVSADILEYTLNVEERTVRLACGEQSKPLVNGSLPGPTIKAREGDTLVVHVLNNSPYNITIHWHGVFQLYTNWVDGPAYVTQCPIVPKTSFTQKFNVTGQEGTLFYHAHFSALRESIYGAIVIRPRRGRTYPFPKPYKEVPILLGEWFGADMVELEEELVTSGGGGTLPDARTINGRPGPLYPCSDDNIFKLKVVRGKTYLLRMVNAGLEDHLFFKIAGHTFTVVAVDARYTEPYKTDVIVLSQGQSADVLFTANQNGGSYYMAARAYSPTLALQYSNGTATALVEYEGAGNATSPVLPDMPDFRDTATAHRFWSNLTSLTNRSNPHWSPVPRKVDVNMFVTVGLGLEPCGGNNTCANPLGSQYRFSSNLNNVSFLNPTSISILEAYFRGINGVFTDDFPDFPPIPFNYTDPRFEINFTDPNNPNIDFGLNLAVLAKKETRVKRLKYNSVVDIVLQNTAMLAAENHPMHFHGFDFYVLAYGFGNYNPRTDRRKYNLVNPQERNTVSVPIGGWAVIRFRAINPGMWFVHCHRETHVPWGLGTVILIENGPTPETSLPPPPADYPRC